jgi:hypothetical protein
MTKICVALIFKFILSCRSGEEKEPKQKKLTDGLEHVKKPKKRPRELEEKEPKQEKLTDRLEYVKKPKKSPRELEDSEGHPIKEEVNASAEETPSSHKRKKKKVFKDSQFSENNHEEKPEEIRWV